MREPEPKPARTCYSSAEAGCGCGARDDGAERHAADGPWSFRLVLASYFSCRALHIVRGRRVDA